MLQISLLEKVELNQSHYSPVVFHVNLIALQENVEHLLMNVIYGQNTNASLAKLDPNGYWVKMYLGYCQVKMDGSLEEYLGICPKWGTLLDGQLTEQVLSGRFIEEKGCFSLPTPVTSDIWTTSLKSTQRKEGSRHSVNLPQAVMMLPTPTSSMWRGATTKRYKGSKEYKGSFTQEALRNGEEDARYINPNYVELLMGFPDKWTDLNV